MNHLWWCCSSCDGDSEVRTEKWLSILYHIRGIYSWEGGKHFHKCEHDPVEKERKWLKAGSLAFKALSSVVNDKKVLSDLKYLGKF